MNNKISIFAELSSAVRMPRVEIFLNKSQVHHSTQIVQQQPFSWKVSWDIETGLIEHNVLEVIMSDKTDRDNICDDGTVIDHMIKIKQIRIDDIDADWILYDRAIFRHNMPPQWIENMATNGFVIEPEYRPGTDLRINGTMTFEFDQPFWLDVIKSTDKIKT